MIMAALVIFSSSKIEGSLYPCCILGMVSDSKERTK